MDTRKRILKITLSAMFFAIGLLLPFLTGQIQTIGQMLSPMHIPILICSFVCGWQYGLVVGFALPILRSFMFSMPPMYPGAITMSFELGTYGLFCGILYSISKKIINNKFGQIYPCLVISMIVGRIIWGIVRYAITLIDNTLTFTMDEFVSGALLTVWPGMILQLILVPIIVFALEKSNLLNKLH